MINHQVHIYMRLIQSLYQLSASVPNPMHESFSPVLLVSYAYVFILCREILIFENISKWW